MTTTERQALADLIRERRSALGISGYELARRAGVDRGLLTLLDQKKIAQPRIDTLRAIAEVLEIRLVDLYAVINYLPDDALPSLRPYMRAKYDDLPDEAVDAVERYIERLSKKYRHGPTGNEDEH